MDTEREESKPGKGQQPPSLDPNRGPGTRGTRDQRTHPETTCYGVSMYVTELKTGGAAYMTGNRQHAGFRNWRVLAHHQLCLYNVHRRRVGQGGRRQRLERTRCGMREQRIGFSHNEVVYQQQGL
jgi:hypothetical protein